MAGEGLTISKANYQTETITLRSDTDSVPTIDLALLRKERAYSIRAVNTDGAELNADVTLNGAAAGKTPLQLPITFQRLQQIRAVAGVQRFGGGAGKIQGEESNP